MMNTQSATARSTWPAWVAVVPAGLGIAETGLLGLHVLGSIFSLALDDSLPASYHGQGWLNAGLVGQLTLSMAAIVLLLLGVARPGWRRPTAIAAWMIIPLALGLFVLCTTLGTQGQ